METQKFENYIIYKLKQQGIYVDTTNKDSVVYETILDIINSLLKTIKDSGEEITDIYSKMIQTIDSNMDSIVDTIREFQRLSKENQEHKEETCEQTSLSDISRTALLEQFNIQCGRALKILKDYTVIDSSISITTLDDEVRSLTDKELDIALGEGILQQIKEISNKLEEIIVSVNQRHYFNKIESHNKI